MSHSWFLFPGSSRWNVQGTKEFLAFQWKQNPYASSLTLVGRLASYAYSLPFPSWAVLCLIIQSCMTLCDPMGCSLPGSSVGILQARILECVAMPSRWSSQPKDWAQVSCITDRFFTIWVGADTNIKRGSKGGKGEIDTFCWCEPFRPGGAKRENM